MNTISIQVSPETHARIAKFRASNGGMTMEAAIVLLLDIVETMENEALPKGGTFSSEPLPPGGTFSNLLPADWKPSGPVIEHAVERIKAAETPFPCPPPVDPMRTGIEAGAGELARTIMENASSREPLFALEFPTTDDASVRDIGDVDSEDE